MIPLAVVHHRVLMSGADRIIFLYFTYEYSNAMFSHPVKSDETEHFNMNKSSESVAQKGATPNVHYASQLRFPTTNTEHPSSPVRTPKLNEGKKKKDNYKTPIGIVLRLLCGRHDAKQYP